VVDLVIAGGGPAGLATAIAARLRGFQVIVLDRARPPLDKACGEALMPDGVAVLEGLGVDLRGVDSHPFRGIRYIDDLILAEGVFPGVPGLGVRRTELHGALRRREARVEIGNAQYTGHVDHRSCGSSASRRPSPMKLRQNSVTARNAAGKASIHGAVSI